MLFSRCVIFTGIILFLTITVAFSKVSLDKYGSDIRIDAMFQKAAVLHQADSMLFAGSVFQPRAAASSVEVPRILVDKTIDFYLLVLLCLLLGLVRYTDPRYFNNLFRVFANPSQSSASKEQIQSSTVSNAVMNMFFVIVAGTYMYYAINTNTVKPDMGGYRSYFILMLIAGIALVYAAKYVVLGFTGWVFKIKHITEYYIFNVFLMNKITAILLLPVTIILAFAGAAFSKPIFIISLVIVTVLFCLRYLRSWRAFGSFFQYSKFHFFTYLCASEILPLAVLMKLLVDSLQL